MVKRISLTAAEIPLFLIPKMIAILIWQKGDAVYRISVKRTHWHHYNISVRTKAIRRELAPVPVAVLEMMPGRAQHAKKAGRGCAA